MAPTTLADLELVSPAFDAGRPIPDDHAREHRETSPPLRWRNAPEGVASWALIVDDPDAPGTTFTHWLLWNLEPEQRQIEPGYSTDEGELDHGARQGRNDFDELGWGGPRPPAGETHTYHFRLYALDTTLDLGPGADRQQLLDALDGHVIDQAELTGVYSR